jgi:hypothetical protein
MSHQSDLISEDILAYLGQHERKELLRFLTCGNVDDGKSTLIGRLLHDSKMIYEDHLEAITRDSKKVGTTGDDIDLALLVDGLQAEREQGITIDVAYRYFSTAKRKFIIADTPAMSSTPATWPPVHPPVTWRSSWSMPVTACRPRPVATASSPRCWASSTSSSPSTRWTSRTSMKACSSRSRPTT